MSAATHGRVRSWRRQRSEISRPLAEPPVTVATDGTATRSLWGVAKGLTLAQYARLLTGFLWLGWGDWALSTAGASYMPLLATLTGGCGLAIMVLAVTVTSEDGQRRLDAYLLAGSITLVALSGAGFVANGSLTTDEIALNQGAAVTLLHGANPFTSDLSWTLPAYGISGGSYSLDGSVIGAQTYPALSFLLYAPSVALFGRGSYASVLVNLLFWSGSAVLLWRLLRPSVRSWVPAFLVTPVLFAQSLGDSDPLYIPFMVIAVCCWDRFGLRDERSIARWIGPLALGLACAVKPTPWLVAPFLVAGVAVEAHARGDRWVRVMVRYMAIAGGVFLLPNLPFIVWDPAAWARGVVTPLTAGLIPTGFGPVALINSYGIGGGNLSVFTFASLAALLASLLMFMGRYPLLKRVLPALPFPALFLSMRSAGFYFAFCLPAIAIGAASVAPVVTETMSMRRLRMLRAGGVTAAAAAVLCVVIGLATPAPLQLRVAEARSSADTFTTTVQVSNVSGHRVVPHFLLVQGIYNRGWMHVDDGPPILAAGDSATYRLSLAANPVTPRGGQTFEIDVTTVGPSTISVSAPTVVAETGSS